MRRKVMESPGYETEWFWTATMQTEKEKLMKEKSADQLEALRLMQVEPGRKAVEYLEEGLNIILRSLGVDTDKNVKLQQAELGIHIVDGDEVLKLLGGFPDLEPQGFFIFKDDSLPTAEPEPRPIAYIGDAGIAHGHIVVRIHDFRCNRVFEVKGIRMPQPDQEGRVP